MVEIMHVLEPEAAHLVDPSVSTYKKAKNVSPLRKLKCWILGVGINSENLLIILTIAGVLLGIALGCTLREMSLSDEAIILVKFPGEMLMRMLKMLIIPIIVTSVITGLSNLDLKKSGRMGAHAIAYYVATTTLAVILGVVLVSIIQPGNQKRFSLNNATEQRVISTLDTFLDLIRNLFPENIVAACLQVAQTQLTISEEMMGNSSNISWINNSTIMNKSLDYNHSKILKVERKLEQIPNANVLGIIIFSVFFGVTLSNLKEEGKVVTEFFSVMNSIFMRMITIILWYSPIGICSLLAGNLLTLGGVQDLIESLGMYMLTVIAGLMIHLLITLPLIYVAITRKNPFRVYYATSQAFLTALGTASSAGTLPLSIQCLEENLGIDKRVTKFVLPLGATMNMDGTALLEGVAAITIAQMYQYSLSAGQIVTISVTATFASIGAAAIPSAGLVTLVLVLSAIGLPSEAVGLLWSIDWLLDRIRTSVNVMGDCIGAVIVQHLNRELLAEDNLIAVDSSSEEKQSYPNQISIVETTS
ncbi:excitatory amino acid transporter-like [Ciona intestinalis]